MNIKLFIGTLVGVMLLCVYLLGVSDGSLLFNSKLNGLQVILLPWGIFLAFIFIAINLVKWAKKRRSSAYVFGAMVQMLLPDPYVERTIKLVQEDKKVVKKQKESEGEPK
ncbi:hypothetical protein [Candidatus Enterovibrio escicola]|uniref:hypothetical protein n=1 Tax=Candidatus Enterovibrio escicola TaxID=1927127 RepID=UPI001237B30B|nr:hypothetical protein [Candidatus Enterovibrio escacola]